MICSGNSGFFSSCARRRASSRQAATRSACTRRSRCSSSSRVIWLKAAASAPISPPERTSTCVCQSPAATARAPAASASTGRVMRAVVQKATSSASRMPPIGHQDLDAAQETLQAHLRGARTAHQKSAHQLARSLRADQRDGVKRLGAGGVGGPLDGAGDFAALLAQSVDQRRERRGLRQRPGGADHGLRLAIQQRAHAGRQHERRQKIAVEGLAADHVQLACRPRWRRAPQINASAVSVGSSSRFRNGSLRVPVVALRSPNLPGRESAPAIAPTKRCCR